MPTATTHPRICCNKYRIAGVTTSVQVVCSVTSRIPLVMVEDGGYIALIAVSS